MLKEARQSLSPISEKVSPTTNLCCNFQGFTRVFYTRLSQTLANLSTKDRQRGRTPAFATTFQTELKTMNDYLEELLELSFEDDDDLAEDYSDL